MVRVKISLKDYDFEAEAVIEKEVKPFGKGSAHIILPKKWVGHTVVIAIRELTGQWLTGYKKKYKNEKKVPFP